MGTWDTVLLPASSVPVAGRCDVAVCGGGPAGIAAAIAAARRGVRTVLIEQLSFLGGMASGAFVNGWCDTQNGPLAAELEARLIDLGVAKRRYEPEQHLCEVGRLRFEADMMAVVALRLVCDAGARVMFGTMAASAWQPEGDAVEGVVVVNKGGRSVLEAKVVIDATADGDIAASAGGDVRQGDPDDGRIQHVNYRFRIAGVDGGEYKRLEPSPERILDAVRAAHRAGQLQPPTGVFRPPAETFPFEPVSKKLVLTGWEIEKVDPTDPESVSRCLTECQLAALDVVEFCRAHLPGHEHCRVERLPSLLGTRESRRVVGHYVLTRDDVIGGRKFEDGIARCCFFVDLHDSPPGLTVPFPMAYKRATMPPPGDWYEIPYGCLVPRGVSGLLTAGRCISCERSGQGSLRLQPTCMYTGEAAGIAAAMAVDEGKPPHELDGRCVRRAIGL